MIGIDSKFLGVNLVNLSLFQPKKLDLVWSYTQWIPPQWRVSWNAKQLRSRQHLPLTQDAIVKKTFICDDCILGAGVDPQYSYEKILHQIIEGIFRPGNKAVAVLGDYWGRAMANNPAIPASFPGRGGTEGGTPRFLWNTFRCFIKSWNQVTLVYSLLIT